MDKHGAEVGVDWVNGLVLHEGDAEWHPWDDATYGPNPHYERKSGDSTTGAER